MAGPRVNAMRYGVVTLRIAKVLTVMQGTHTHALAGGPITSDGAPELARVPTIVCVRDELAE